MNDLCGVEDGHCKEGRGGDLAARKGNGEEGILQPGRGRRGYEGTRVGEVCGVAGFYLVDEDLGL